MPSYIVRASINYSMKIEAASHEEAEALATRTPLELWDTQETEYEAAEEEASYA